jgi:hypothetical protein
MIEGSRCAATTRRWTASTLRSSCYGGRASALSLPGPMSENVKRGPGFRFALAPDETLRFSFSVQSWAMTGIRQIEPLYSAFRNESDDRYHEVDSAVVADQVT